MATTYLQEVDDGDSHVGDALMLVTSMAGPLGSGAGRTGRGHHMSWRRQWWAPLGGNVGRTGRVHHLSWRRRWWAPEPPSRIWAPSVAQK
jgi:hypothetical protein